MITGVIKADLTHSFDVTFEQKEIGIVANCSLNTHLNHDVGLSVVRAQPLKAAQQK
jgi:hypothetical protein